MQDIEYQLDNTKELNRLQSEKIKIYVQKDTLQSLMYQDFKRQVSVLTSENQRLTDKEKSFWHKRFYFGFGVGAGYGVINNKFDVFVGVQGGVRIWW